MNIKKTFALLTALVAFPFAANAVPAKYDLTFAGTGYDANGGKGSFLWDVPTGAFSNFTWDFGGGNVGGITGVNYSQPVFGSTLGRFLFEILTLQDVHPLGCSLPSLNCGVSFSSSSGGGLAGTPFSQMTFSDNQTYGIVVGRNGYTGAFSTRRASVPEPGMLVLAGLALLLIGAARRRTA